MEKIVFKPKPKTRVESQIPHDASAKDHACVSSSDVKCIRDHQDNHPNKRAARKPKENKRKKARAR